MHWLILLFLLRETLGEFNIFLHCFENRCIFFLCLFLTLSLSLIHFKEQEKFVKISSLSEFQPAKLFVEFVNFNMIDYKVHFKNQLLGQLNF